MSLHKPKDSIWNLSFVRSQALASALDPLVYSGTMFLVQFSVLMTVDKTSFANYSLAYSYILMGQTVLSALFGGPLITALSEIEDLHDREAEGASALKLQLIIAVSIASVGVAFAIIFDVSVVTSALAALAMVGFSFRDALRNVLAVQMRLHEALRNAARFAITTSLALGIIYLTGGRITEESGLTALVIGAVVPQLNSIRIALAARARLSSNAVKRLAGMAVWSVPGATFVWLQNSFYLTLVAINLSLGAVGEVSAARMVVMPVLITTSGLLRLAQVQASREIRNNGLASAIRVSRTRAYICFFSGVMLTIACWIANDLIDPSLIPNGHPNLFVLVAAWITFAAAATARGFYSALFQALGSYRELFLLSTIILPFVLVGIAMAPKYIGLSGAILPMSLGEMMLLIVLAIRVRLRGENLRIAR